MPLIELQNASVFLGAEPVLFDLNWRIERGQHFAILGGNGAGKSTFLRLIAGRIWPRPHDSRFYDFGGGRTWSPLRARPKMALLSPEIQERFARQSRDGVDGERGWQLDARTAVTAGLFDAELLHQTPSQEQRERVDGCLAQLQISDLAGRPLQTLSQGQLRRVLLARALVSRPELLLLDEACSGLDAKSRVEMLEMLEIIAASGQTTLGLTTHRAEEIVPAIRAVFRLENGRFVGENSSETASENGGVDVRLASSANRTAPNSANSANFPFASVSGEASSRAQNRAAEAQESGTFARFQPSGSRGNQELEAGASPANEISPPASELIRLENASVFLDGAPVLRDLDWIWNRGQHFAVEGGNGSGKTTLLRLLRGELFPARGGKIARFGEEKLRSRAEIGRQIALLSPALQAIYSDEIAVETAVASGFFDSFGVRGEISDWQRARVAEILEICDLTGLQNRSFARLSHGQRRRVLLARALVANPQILLLDEALDGLDANARAEFHEILAEIAARGTHLAVVSHHAGDYPPFLTHFLRLENGEISAMGRR